MAFTAWWPAVTTLADSIPYSGYADADPLGDPQHPAGYPTLLALFGLVSRDLAVAIAIQHALGILSGLLFFAAVRRMVRSPWPALAPAALILLSADIVYLEHTIMSEGPFLATLSLALYASVRTIDETNPWWPWPIAAAALIVVATVIRPAAAFMLPVLLLAMVMAQERPWRERIRAPIATAGVAMVLLGGYALVNLIANNRFEVGPTQGWHLYGRVAQFADCTQFTPPDGTKALCESTDPRQRPGVRFYLYLPDSPAWRTWGREPWREHDGDMGAWARQVILHQPKTYLDTISTDLRTYFVPSTAYPRPFSGGDLDSELDWSRVPSEETARSIEQGMESLFNPFERARNQGSINFLHDWQRVFRFGATLLSICAFLILIGLLVGPRRNRIGVLLFGVGGLAMLAGPLIGNYGIGRYTVPIGPFVVAGAAIAVLSIWRLESARRASYGGQHPD